jgi:hypothetical protein
MKARILIVEDTPAELEKACAAAVKLGLEVLCCDPTDEQATWMELMEGVDGVVTDLFWAHGKPTYRMGRNVFDNHTYHPSRPSGLLVVIHAVSKGLPVVVCSDIGDSSRYEHGHHGPEAGFIYDGYHGKTDLRSEVSRRSGRPPESFPGTFGLEDSKDWEWALQCLSLTIADRQSTSPPSQA